MLGPGNKKLLLWIFSVTEIKRGIWAETHAIKPKITLNQVEDALFYLSKIGALSIEGGFLVVYNGCPLSVLNWTTKGVTKTEDYQKLDQYYKNRIEQSILLVNMPGWW